MNVFGLQASILGPSVEERQDGLSSLIATMPDDMRRRFLANRERETQSREAMQLRARIAELENEL